MELSFPGTQRLSPKLATGSAVSETIARCCCNACGHCKSARLEDAQVQEGCQMLQVTPVLQVERKANVEPCQSELTFTGLSDEDNFLLQRSNKCWSVAPEKWALPDSQRAGALCIAKCNEAFLVLREDAGGFSTIIASADIIVNGDADRSWLCHHHGWHCCFHCCHRH